MCINLAFSAISFFFSFPHFILFFVYFFLIFFSLLFFSHSVLFFLASEFTSVRSGILCPILYLLASEFTSLCSNLCQFYFIVFTIAFSCQLRFCIRMGFCISFYSSFQHCLFRVGHRSVFQYPFHFICHHILSKAEFTVYILTLFYPLCFICHFFLLTIEWTCSVLLCIGFRSPFIAFSLQLDLDLCFCIGFASSFSASLCSPRFRSLLLYSFY